MESCPSGPVASPIFVSARVALTSLFLLLSLLLTSCQKPSRDDRMAVHDNASFDEWVAKHSDVLTPTEIRELTEARQQIRFRVMQTKTGMPPEEFTKAVYDDINGKTVREFLLMSYALQIDRVNTELANFQPQLKRFENRDANHRLNEDEKAYVTKSLSTLHEKMKQREDELARLKARAEELKQLPATAP